MRRALWAMWRREMLLALRRTGDVAHILAFFVIAAAMFPLALGPQESAKAGLGAIWTLALFSTTLGVDRLFADDARSGALDLQRMSPAPLALLALVRCVAHWLLIGPPLAALAPALALALGFQPSWALSFSILLGSPSLVLIAAIAAALGVGARRGASLIALIALPLDIPVLIFGVAAAGEGPFADQARSFLAAGAALACALAPAAIAAALRSAGDGR